MNKPKKISISFPAILRCFGMNREKLESLGSSKISPSGGTEMVLTLMVSLASPPKRLVTWVPIGLYLSLCKLFIDI